jgi:hypothetical protein
MDKNQITLSQAIEGYFIAAHARRLSPHTLARPAIDLTAAMLDLIQILDATRDQNWENLAPKVLHDCPPRSPAPRCAPRAPAGAHFCGVTTSLCPVSPLVVYFPCHTCSPTSELAADNRAVQEHNPAPDVALFQSVDFTGGTDPHGAPFDYDRVSFRIVELTIRVETKSLGNIMPVTSRGIGGPSVSCPCVVR